MPSKNMSLKTLDGEQVEPISSNFCKDLGHIIKSERGSNPN